MNATQARLDHVRKAGVGGHLWVEAEDDYDDGEEGRAPRAGARLTGPTATQTATLKRNAGVPACGCPGVSPE